jgi:hypothetical protein
MLDQIFNRIEREFGPAFWSMAEASHPNVPPPIRRVDQEVNFCDDALQIRVRFENDGPALALNIPTRDLGGIRCASLNRVDRFIVDLKNRAESGFRLYLRWSYVGLKMIEHHELDRDSITAQTLSVEANRLERLAVDRFPEAARKIQEEVRQSPRFREAFAYCHSRATPTFGADRDEFRDDRMTATTLRMREEHAREQARRRFEIEYERMARMALQIQPEPVYTPGVAGGGGGSGLAYAGVIAYGGGGGGGCSIMGVDFASGPDRTAVWRRGIDGYINVNISPAGIGSPYVSHAAAEERAWGLLLEHLTDAQRRGLEQHGHFHVTGGRTGQTYRIRRGTQVNIDVLGRGNRVVDRLCFQPRGAPTTGDTMLAQKVMLELDEDEALRAAVRHGASGMGYGADFSRESILQLWRRTFRGVTA